MNRHQSSIRSGETRLIYEYLPEWLAGMEDDFIQFDGLVSDTDLCNFLQELKPIPFYRYMTRYLLSRYPDTSRRLAEQLNCTTDDYKEFLAEKIFDEITVNPTDKRKPLQKEFSRLVWNAFIANGFGIMQQDQLRVYGHLEKPDLLWDFSRLREALFAREIKDHTFFVLALGLNMNIQDVFVFLQKALLRRQLSPYHPNETLLQLCLERGSGNLIRLYRDLQAAYSATICHKGRSETLLPGKLLDTLLSSIQPGTLCQVTPELQVWLAKYKSALESPASDAASPNQAFFDLYQELNKTLGPELHNVAETQLLLPCGTVSVFVKPECNLTIPADTVFFDSDGNPIAVSTAEVSTLSWNTAQSIEVEVWAKKPIDKTSFHIPKHQTFSCIKDEKVVFTLQNKSAVKAEGAKARDGKYYLRATLEGVCNGETRLPAGTLFTYNKTEFETKTDVFFSRLPVPVEARAEAAGDDVRFIPKNTLCSTNLPPEEQCKICNIQHPPLKRQQKGVDGVSRFLQYLYHPCAPRDRDMILGHVADAFPSMEKREAIAHFVALLDPVLSGNRLTDTRRTQLKQANKPLVKRAELLTLAFLMFSIKLQTSYNTDTALPVDSFFSQFSGARDAWEQASDMHDCLNSYLETYGFHALYYANSYDRLLHYLSLFENPFAAYQLLWCIYLTCKQEMEVLV